VIVFRWQLYTNVKEKESAERPRDQIFDLRVRIRPIGMRKPFDMVQPVKRALLFFSIYVDPNEVAFVSLFSCWLGKESSPFFRLHALLQKKMSV
jgi:hypothetical protein